MPTMETSSSVLTARIQSMWPAYLTIWLINSIVYSTISKSKNLKRPALRWNSMTQKLTVANKPLKSSNSTVRSIVWAKREIRPCRPLQPWERRSKTMFQWSVWSKRDGLSLRLRTKRRARMCGASRSSSGKPCAPMPNYAVRSPSARKKGKKRSWRFRVWRPV